MFQPVSSEGGVDSKQCPDPSASDPVPSVVADGPPEVYFDDNTQFIEVELRPDGGECVHAGRLAIERNAF